MTIPFYRNIQVRLAPVPRPSTTVVAATLLLILLAPVGSSSATECSTGFASYSLPAERMPEGTGTPPPLLPLTLTIHRDLYAGLLLSPIREAAPLLRSSRFGRVKLENRITGSGETCGSQYVPAQALVNPAVLTSSTKRASRLLTPAMKGMVLFYNGSRRNLKTRLMPQENEMNARKTASMIGPIQEIDKPSQFGTAPFDQAIAVRLPQVDPLPLFQQRSIMAIDSFQTGIRPPGNESLRMNMTTTQALHGGNCANGCP